MWKRILKKVLTSEKFLDAVLTIISASLDLNYTDEEKAEIKKKAIDALMDMIL